MIKSKINFSAILLIAVTWLASSLGDFTGTQVDDATEVFFENLPSIRENGLVLKYLPFSIETFTRIVITNQSNLNSFAISTLYLQNFLNTKNITKPDQANLKFFVQIPAEVEGNFDFFELRRHPKEFIVLLSNEKLENTDSFKVSLSWSNGKTPIEIDAIPIEGKFPHRTGGYRFGVLVELEDLLKFEETTEVIVKNGNYVYKFHNPNDELPQLQLQLPPNQDLTIKAMAFTLFVQGEKVNIDPLEIKESGNQQLFDCPIL